MNLHKVLLRSLVASLVFLGLSPIQAQFIQQGGKLVGTGAVGDAVQGASVALSADGNTAIVGGSYDSSYAGATWVFTRSSGVWSQQGSKLVGTGAVGGSSFQGASVALSADGNTAIVGGHHDSPEGAAWVFARSSGVWSQQGSKLVGTGAVGGAMQGWSIALSADGNTAIVGGYFDSSGAGAAWVFTRTSGVWTQQGGKLVGTGAVGGASYQGNSVALSAEGNTAIVGGTYDSSGIGAAWVFTRSSGVWSQQGSKLVGTGALGSAMQGSSVALSADGNTAIVGGFYDNTGAGAAWVFTRSETPVREEAANVPSQSVLEQNYPNPFNPSTKIQFSIDNRQLAIVKVIDMLGREVATLVNEVKEPGTYTVEFRASSLASGVYFYRLQAGTYVETKKLLLLR
jgi:hypothetical protein